MITLEPITQQNAMFFREVRLRALQDTPTAFGSTYAKESNFTDAEWVRRAAQWNGERSCAYLAMDERTPCGILGGFLEQEDASRAGLISMWVSPSHRRQGVGALLVNALFSWARTRGARVMQLMVTCNNDAAIKFYQRLGFVLTGRTEPYPNDPLLVEYEMSMPII